mmetsp:Transcript_2480/g.7070  ORF Transcript_2480/g.7070 Transcript_2480/m.7070 type:complete len:94 (-) Transcript_2480:717-998(-)
MLVLQESMTQQLFHNPLPELNSQSPHEKFIPKFKKIPNSTTEKLLPCHQNRDQTQLLLRRIFFVPFYCKEATDWKILLSKKKFQSLMLMFSKF